MILVRWQKGTDRRKGIFPSAGVIEDLPCPLCGLRLDEDLPIQLVAVGPEPGDETSQREHDEGRWYAAMACAMHEGCVDSLVMSNALERFVGELEVVDPDA